MKIDIDDNLSTIFESVHNGVVIVDYTGKILVFNKAARTLYDLSRTETVGRYMSEILFQSWKEMASIISSGEPQIGKRLKVGDSNIIANISAILKDGKAIGVVSIFQEIMELELLVDDLQAYKILTEELDVIFNTSYDGLWVSDAKGKTLRVNPASAGFIGLKPEDVVGRNMVDLVEEGYFDRSATLEVLERGHSVSFMQTQKDGRQILVTGNPVCDEHGQIHLVVVNARDLTALNDLRIELEKSQGLNRHYQRQVSQLHNRYGLESKIVARSEAMQRVFDTALKVSEVDSTVIIGGESGVGKGLLANYIHEASARKDGPLVRVDCGAIPESLIESELFGYVKGAFTGALEKGKKGYFELAHGGTLFLDEIGELPLNVQARLLRFFEESEMVPVGATETLKIDTRIIAATNRDLEEMVRTKDFRKDLFFRLRVVPLHLPPLRSRQEDIPPLINHFLHIFNKKCSTNKHIAAAVVDTLCDYHFPGNVRELANLMERLVVLTTGSQIEMVDLPASFRQQKASVKLPWHTGQWDLPNAISQLESELIKEALKTFKSQREAARHLGIDHSTLSRKIKKLDLYGA